VKLLFTSDWHLGKYIYSRSMLEDQQWFIDNCFFPAIEEYSPDCIVIAGDIFDRAIAPTAALALFDDVLTRIARMGIPLVAITGNHDGAERMALGTRIMRASGIHIFTEVGDCLDKVELTDADGLRVILHPLPYFDPSVARAFAGDEETRGYAELYAHALSRIDLSDGGTRHVLISHCTVLGSLFSDSESGVMVGGSSEIPAEYFAPYDLVLLGHLHSHQKPADNVIYSGSPLRYSFSTTERDKRLIMVDITSDNIEFTPLPVRPLRELRVIQGSFDWLLSDAVAPSEDYIHAELTDGQYIYEPMMRLREKFPNILGIRYSENVALGEDQGDRAMLRSRLRTRSIGDREIFDAFLRQMCGIEPTDDDLDRFDSLISEVTSQEVNDCAP